MRNENYLMLLKDAKDFHAYILHTLLEKTTTKRNITGKIV